MGNTQVVKDIIQGLQNGNVVIMVDNETPVFHVGSNLSTARVSEMLTELDRIINNQGVIQ